MLKNIKDNSFYFATMVLTCVIAVRFLVVPAILLLIVSWILNGGFKEKLHRLKSNRWIWVFASVYLFYLVGLLYSADMTYALKDIELKLSLLLFPIIYGTSYPELKGRYVSISKAYSISIAVIALLSFVFGAVEAGNIPQYGELDLFLHPSYLSMYLNLGIVLIVFGLKNNSYSKTLVWMVILVFLVFVIFLSMSKSGIIISILLIMGFSIQYMLEKKKVVFLILSILVLLPSIFASYQLLPGFKERFKYMGKIFAPSEIDPSSSESSQLRVLIWEQAWHIFKENPLFGVGTGDIKNELLKKYDEHGIVAALQKKLNAHNQFLQTLGTLGLFGFTVFILAFLWPSIFSYKINNGAYLYFVLIIVCSLSVESMLERQDGVVFYAFFNSLLFFQYFNKSEESIGKF